MANRPPNECRVFGAAADPDDPGAGPALDARFEIRLEAQAQTAANSAATLTDPVDIDLELYLSQALFPISPVDLKRNQDREWVLKHLPSGAVGALVGVFRGRFAEAVLSNRQPSKLYLIDPWEKLGPYFGWRYAYAKNGLPPTGLARRETALRAAKYPEVVFVEAALPQGASQIQESAGLDLHRRGARLCGHA